jgi:membrane-associated phospholipid phosphatase
MHYGVDALAGLAVGGLVTWLVGATKSVSGKAGVYTVVERTPG